MLRRAVAIAALLPLAVLGCDSRPGAPAAEQSDLWDLQFHDISELFEQTRIAAVCAIESAAYDWEAESAPHGLSEASAVPAALAAVVSEVPPLRLGVDEFAVRWFEERRIALSARSWDEESGRLKYAVAMEVQLLLTQPPDAQAADPEPFWAVTAVELASSCS